MDMTLYLLVSVDECMSVAAAAAAAAPFFSSCVIYGSLYRGLFILDMFRLIKR